MSATIRVKRLRCRVCGGPKVTAIRTAFVYCDYCGALTDWDFYIANSTAGSAQPDPQYEALYQYLRPPLAEARFRGDQGAYARAQRQLFDMHVRTCPAAYSPRVGDPSYRAAIIEFHVAARVVSDFDPTLWRLSAEVERADGTMRWTDEGTRRWARSDRFWNLFRAWHTHHATALEAHDRMGVVRMHPDSPSLDLLLRIEASAFVQKWLSVLRSEDAEALLSHTGLKGDYEDQQVPITNARHCGACGRDLPVVKGARRILCFECGFLIDVAAAEISCQNCGSPMSAPHGARMLACPYCRSQMQIIHGG